MLRGSGHSPPDLAEGERPVKMVAEYLERTRQFERMADTADGPKLKKQFLDRATASSLRKSAPNNSGCVHGPRHNQSETRRRSPLPFRHPGYVD